MRIRTNEKDRVDIEFDLRDAFRYQRRQRQIQAAATYLQPGLERYCQVNEHYLALNSSTPSQPSGAPSSIS